MDSGSLFHFSRHCRIGHFSISHKFTSLFSRNSAKWLTIQIQTPDQLLVEAAKVQGVRCTWHWWRCALLSLVHSGDKVECRSDFRQKSILSSRSNEPATKSNEPATMLPVWSTLSPVRLTVCIFMSMCWSYDVISVKWQTTSKTNNSKISHKKINICLS